MSTQADICNIAGFIFDDRGPVADGFLVTITNKDLAVSYNTTTGNVWPASNYYLQTITCTVGKDRIEIMAIRGADYADTLLVPQTRLEQVNLTLPPALENSLKPPSKEGSGGGNSGGVSPIPIRRVDTQKDEAYDLPIGSELAIYSLDKWFNQERYIIKIEQTGGGTARLVFVSGAVDLIVGKKKDADINGDGIPDYAVLLEGLDGGVARLKFYKAWNPVLKMEGINLTERPVITESPKLEIDEDNNMPLIILLSILILLTLVLIIRDRRDRK